MCIGFIFRGILNGNKSHLRGNVTKDKVPQFRTREEPVTRKILWVGEFCEPLLDFLDREQSNRWFSFLNPWIKSSLFPGIPNTGRGMMKTTEEASLLRSLYTI